MCSVWGKKFSSGEDFKDCKHVALQNGVWKTIPPLGGDERQQGDTGGNVEAGSHGFLHWQSVREGEYGCIC